MNNVKFEFYIGDTYTRDIVIKKYQETISEMYFTVKKNTNDKDFVLQKKLSDGITLTDVVLDEEGKIIERTYNLLINASDTEDMTPEKEYVFDIEIITPVSNGEDIKKTIVFGTCKLTSAVTRAYNEGSVV